MTKASSIQGIAIGVADGDTITILDSANTQHKVRLRGIDAPEKSQPFGRDSKLVLEELVYNKQVRVDFQKKDKYGRLVGTVWQNDLDICLALIKTGWVWHYKHFESEQSRVERDAYSQAELEAKAKKIGIWKEINQIPPWEFRNLQK